MRRFIAVASFALIAACTPDGGDRSSPAPALPVDDRFHWAEGGEGLSVFRTEVAAASDGDVLVFVAGGFDESGDASDAVEILDTSEGVWLEDVPQLPNPVHHAALVYCRGGPYLIGGYDTSGIPTNKVLRYDPTGWRPAPDMPTPRGALAAACVDGMIHVVGGAAMVLGELLLAKQHEVFDPIAKRWTSAPPLPEPRDHLAAASDGERLFVVGGRRLSLTTNTNRLDIYDPATDSWARGPDMPTSRGGLAATPMGKDRIVVVGGERPETTIAAAEVYLIAEDGWVRAPDMPTPRHGLGAATVYADQVYVVGGGPEPGLSVSGAAEVLSSR